MFGFSFSELVVVVIVALVVMGPKDLPKMLRRLGQWSGKLRRAAADLRAQSGIDDALRSDGLADDINEIRKLARGEIDAVRQIATVNFNDNANGSANITGTTPKLLGTGSSSSSSQSYSHSAQEQYGRPDDFHVMREREYPRDGADAYNALPDNAVLYTNTLPRSELARDALYRMGDASAEIPPDPPDVVGPTLMGIGPGEVDGGNALHDGLEPPDEHPADEQHANGDANADANAKEPEAAAAIPTLIGVAALPDSSPNAADAAAHQTPADEHQEAH